ncbi:hypothetical protein [uncultured Ezakiella sp.]|mgnify:FL=1|uniref:hypothetical protein n=1 Tax=uncultured Ezakiella sp. TaxID=1637529 RepID=UPI0025F08187|nr:hypothetical protein [uncultured Ezakiella sp.]
MNINFTEALILNYMLKNMNSNVNEYHIFESLKDFNISSSDLVVELIKLKEKNIIEEVANGEKRLVLSPQGLTYAKNVVDGRLEYVNLVQAELKPSLADNKSQYDKAAPVISHIDEVIDEDADVSGDIHVDEVVEIIDEDQPQITDGTKE